MELKKEPVVIVFSILAALQVIDAALVLADSVNETAGAIISMVIAALTAAATVYVRGMVTPWVDVVSKIQNGTVVAGPAAGPAGNTGIVGPEAGGTPPPPAPPRAP